MREQLLRLYIGAAEDMAHSSLRFGMGRFTTEAEVDYVVEKIVAVVQRLRDMRYGIRLAIVLHVVTSYLTVHYGRWCKKALTSTRSTGPSIDACYRLLSYDVCTCIQLLMSCFLLCIICPMYIVKSNVSPPCGPWNTEATSYASFTISFMCYIDACTQTQMCTNLYIISCTSSLSRTSLSLDVLSVM